MTINVKKFSASLTLNLYQLSDKKPEYKVVFNGTVVSCNQLDQLNPVFGENILEVSLLNKQVNDTKVDSQGNIVEDLAVEIASLVVEGTDITDYLKMHGQFITDAGIETTHGFLYKNGTFEYKFNCPIFYFLRNQNILNND